MPHCSRFYFILQVKLRDSDPRIWHDEETRTAVYLSYKEATLKTIKRINKYDIFFV